MGLMRWLRGGDENTTATAMMSAGLAEIAGIFQPTRHKQTEHIEEMKNRRVEVGHAAGIDLDRGIVVIRRRTTARADATQPQPHEPQPIARTSRSASQSRPASTSRDHEHDGS